MFPKRGVTWCIDSQIKFGRQVRDDGVGLRVTACNEINKRVSYDREAFSREGES